MKVSHTLVYIASRTTLALTCRAQILWTPGGTVGNISGSNVGIGNSAPQASRLAPLSEVEQHIETSGHLPGIPSAREVAEHGISVGEVQAKLLAKIEELTLHVTQQEKQHDRLAHRVQQLEAENKCLSSRISP